MARQKNDGKGRMGGRAKGTPNKTTAAVKDWLSEIMDGERERFLSALHNLPDEEFVKHYIALMPYIKPKMQSVDVRATIEQEYKEIERLIDIAPDDVVDKIAAKMMALKKKEGGNG